MERLPYIIGATVAGPPKLKEGRENQDAILCEKMPHYLLGVVCDGMGSKPFSAQGAKAATLAVSQAMKTWMENGNRSPERLIKLIHQDWNIRVESHGARDAATTCLFVAIDQQGNGIAAQLGDGLICWTRRGASFHILEEAKEGFVNETTGLGISKNIHDWRFLKIAGFEKNDSIYLLSDGVSEAVDKEQRIPFLKYLKASYCKWPLVLRRSQLRKSLLQWPNPAHSDDKSVCIIWR